MHSQPSTEYDESMTPEALSLLIEQEDVQSLNHVLDSVNIDERTRLVALISPESRERLLTLLDPETAAYLLEVMPESQALETLDQLEAETAAKIIHELPSDEQADWIAESDHPDEILSAMDQAEAEEIRTLMAYDPDSAGGLMVTEYLAFSSEITVGDVVRQIQSLSEDLDDDDLQYVFVTETDDKLVGVLRLRDLVISPPSRPIRNIMIRDPFSHHTDTTLNDLRSFFDDHNLLGVPVVDNDHRLVGVVHQNAVREALSDQLDSDYLRTKGIIGGEELRTMPLLLRSRRRLAWLSLNILLNVCAASMIAMHQDTLQAVIALAVFLPIISDMSGCSGNQAVAVSMREISLNITRPSDVLRVWFKEISVGLINGITLGILLGFATYLWKGNPFLGMVVGAALAINTIVAVSIGGTIPLVLKKLKLDPALASGPILTTVTDMCGFFTVLSLASIFIDRLV